jgi:hypothetical protein
MMDSLARKHFEAIVALEVDPNSAATKSKIREFNASLDDWLLAISPDWSRSDLKEMFAKSDAEAGK